VNDALELIPSAGFLGAMLLLLVPHFALIALLVVALAAVTALVALTGALLATPYLLARSIRRRWWARRQSAERPLPIPTVTAPTARATSKRFGDPAFAEHTTPTRAQ
jgi:hypothetical protein